jgi:hypothetical protein
MREMDEQIRDLLEKTRRTRYEFLKAELQTCNTALDLAKFELSVDNTEVAEKEVRAIEKGISVLERFLPEMPQGDPRRDVEAKLAELKSDFEPVRVEVQVRRAGE